MQVSFDWRRFSVSECSKIQCDQWKVNQSQAPEWNRIEFASWQTLWYQQMSCCCPKNQYNIVSWRNSWFPSFVDVIISMYLLTLNTSGPQLFNAGDVLTALFHLTRVTNLYVSPLLSPVSFYEFTLHSKRMFRLSISVERLIRIWVGYNCQRGRELNHFPAFHTSLQLLLFSACMSLWC